MKTARISSLVIGIGMILQWAMFLITGNVPELETAPVSISFHLVAEALTAGLLILAFVLLRRPGNAGRHVAVFAQGMLAYTVVNSSGYFAQKEEWPFLLMFGLILFFAILNTFLILRTK